MAQTNERMSITAPKGIVLLIITALIGVGGGYASSARGGSTTEPQVATMAPLVAAGGLSRAEVQQVASEAEQRARAHTDAATAQALADCRRELSTATVNLNNTLVRLEDKLDSVVTDVSALKVDVGALKARRR